MSEMDPTARQDALRARLRANADKLPAELQRLGNALWDPDADPLAHDACRAALPQFIQQEVMGEPVASLYPDVKHHLDHCVECGQEYVELLDLAFAEERGELLKPAAIPRPDLSFLPQPRPTLKSIVLDCTRTILGVLAPQDLPSLDALAEPFFARVSLRTASEARAPYNLTPGTESDSALSTLAATYAATEALVTGVTRAQFDQWQQQGTLEQEFETRAAASAREIGVSEDTAARFARIYAQQNALTPDALRELLTDK